MTNEKRIVAIRYLPQDGGALESGEHFDLLLSEAHILKIYETSFAKLLMTTNKDYLIDPSTWYFHPLIFQDVKKKLTVERLAETYEVEPSNLRDINLEKFVEKVIKFQESVVEKQQKSLEMWIEEKLPKKSKLAYYIPPYFPIMEENDSWFELNTKLLEITQGLRDNLMPILLIGDYELLLNPQVTNYLVSYASNISGRLLGIGVLGFDKLTISDEYLLSFKELVERIINDAKKEVFSIYASPLDQLLGFAGLCYNIEGKGVKVPGVEGGSAAPRVYFSPFKKLFSYPTIKAIISNYREIVSKEDTLTLSLMERLNKVGVNIKTLEAEVSEHLNGKIKFRKSELPKSKRGEYDRLLEEKRELTRKIKVHTLKERHKDVKKNLKTLIKEMERSKEIVEKKEKSKVIAKQYVGHIERWLGVVFS